MRSFAGMYVDGQWRPANGPSISVTSPATGEVLGEVTGATAEDVDVAVKAARQALRGKDWGGLSPKERGEALDRLADGIEARADEFAQLFIDEIGTPSKWSALIHVGTAVELLRTYAKMAAEFSFDEERTGAHGGRVTVRRVPVGVVGMIIPWNAPLFILGLKLGPALAAGCTAVLKTSPDAPLGLSLFSEVVDKAGLPSGVINIISGDVATGEALVANKGVDKVSFTGSTASGRKVAASAAGDIRRFSLELGGKSAAVLLDDVVLDEKTVGGIMVGIVGNNGQVCVSRTRLLVPESRYDEVVDTLAGAFRTLKVGDPGLSDTDIGPLINERARERVEEYVAGAVADGARVVVGGERPDRDGWYVAPTLLADVTNSMTVAREEVFGPVAVVISYKDEDEAVAIANDSDYGLTAAVWAADAGRARGIATQLEAGTVSVNSMSPMDYNAPFGGFKQSGMGRECGPEAIGGYLELQSIISD